MFGGSINISELRDVKIKLSRKENELKDLKEILQSLYEKITSKDKEISDIQKERDVLRLKNEILNEHLERNNLHIDSSAESASVEKLSLIDEYKMKIDKLQKDLEKKNQELQTKSKAIGELQAKKQIDDQLLNKNLEEIKKLKGTIKKYEDGGSSLNLASSPHTSAQKNPSNFKLNVLHTQEIGEFNTDKQKKLNTVIIDAEGLNKKLIDNLSIQLDSLFNGTGIMNTEEEGAQSIFKSPRRSRTPAPEDPQVLPQSSDEEMLTNGLQEIEDPITANQLIEEKKKILNSVQQMQSELVEMMKHSYESQAQTIQKDLQKIDSEKQATLKKTTDQKQIQAIEQQYKQKMDDLQKQLLMFQEKDKQQQQLTKQINSSESKIKNLEDDITKVKKNKETLEKQMKTDTEKFSKFKQSVSKELTNAKKAMTEKDKVVVKLKQDLKKTDLLAKEKISELRGIQKKVYEERVRKELEKKEEYDKKGIDIDRIKQWITHNTDRMLKHTELKEAMERHSAEKERIEDEMFVEGDKLNGLMIEKERKEIEKTQLELAAAEVSEPDEGPILELEEEIYKLTTEIGNINETLDSFEDSYKFHSDKLNILNEEAISLDVDNIEPLKFVGLQSVDAARVTLQTFFSVMLDLNIYKRDLEAKCIESDETILDLNENITLLQKRIEEMSSNQLAIGLAPQESSGNRLLNQVNKDRAIKNIVNNLEGYVEFQDVKNLGLTPNEQNTLTKLSLSKIVNNLKQQLEEEKKKNHNLVLKLEQAIKDKDQYKLKYQNLRKKNTDDAISKEPLQFKDQQLTLQNQQLDQQKTFQSLAAARASKRKGALPSISVDTAEGNMASNGSGSTGQTPNPPPNKYRSRLNQQKSTLVQDEQSAEIISKSGRYAASTQSSGKIVSKKPSFLAPKKSRSHSREDSGEQQQPKLPSFMNGTKAKPGIPKSSGASRRPARQPVIEDVQILNQQSPSVQQEQIKVVPSLRDRRNQRKLEQNDEGTNGMKGESEKVNEEIDKIKEETFQITSNKSHFERRQSRARAFSKKINQERGISTGSGHKERFNMANIKDLEEQDNEESPRASRDVNLLDDEPMPDDEFLDDTMNTSQLGSQTPVKVIEEDSNKWSHEELAYIENFGHKLIGCDCFEGRIVLVFDNFTIREIELATLEEKSSVNILELNGMADMGEKVVDFAVEKELGAIAISTPTTVYIFDFQYKFSIQIPVENIDKVLFCQYNIVVLVKADESVFLVTYNIEDGSELGMYEFKTEGLPVVLKTDNNFLYLSCGIKLSRFTVPDISPQYLVETEHQDNIIDFTLTQQTIVTTSLDKSVIVHRIDSGEQCMNSLEELECDHVESCEDFILTRCQEGSSILAWRQYQGRQDLDFIDEINLDELKSQIGEVLNFKMKGNIVTRFSSDSRGTSYDLVLLVTVINDGILVNALKHKPLSEL